MSDRTTTKTSQRANRVHNSWDEPCEWRGQTTSCSKSRISNKPAFYIQWPIKIIHLMEFYLAFKSNPWGHLFLSVSEKMSARWWELSVPVCLSSTWCEFDPSTAYVVCISICTYFLIWYPYAPTSLFGNTAHCSGYGVAMGCYRLCIVPRTVIVTSQWYDRYCFAEYARTWARHPTTPWQRECTAITDCQSIDSL